MVQWAILLVAVAIVPPARKKAFLCSGEKWKEKSKYRVEVFGPVKSMVETV